MADSIDYDTLISKQEQVVQKAQDRIINAGSPSGEFLKAGAESIQTSVDVLLKLRANRPS
jgi:hypothetical protein